MEEPTRGSSIGKLLFNGLAVIAAIATGAALIAEFKWIPPVGFVLAGSCAIAFAVGALLTRLITSGGIRGRFLVRVWSLVVALSLSIGVVFAVGGLVNLGTVGTGELVTARRAVASPSPGTGVTLPTMSPSQSAVLATASPDPTTSATPTAGQPSPSPSSGQASATFDCGQVKRSPTTPVRNCGVLTLNVGFGGNLDSTQQNWEVGNSCELVWKGAAGFGTCGLTFAVIASGTPFAYTSCESVTGYQRSLLYSEISDGTMVCVRTNERRFSLVRVSGAPTANTVTLNVVTWEPQNAT